MWEAEKKLLIEKLRFCYKTARMHEFVYFIHLVVQILCFCLMNLAYVQPLRFEGLKGEHVYLYTSI